MKDFPSALSGQVTLSHYKINHELTFLLVLLLQCRKKGVGGEGGSGGWNPPSIINGVQSNGVISHMNSFRPQKTTTWSGAPFTETSSYTTVLLYHYYFIFLSQPSFTHYMCSLCHRLIKQ